MNCDSTLNKLDEALDESLSDQERDDFFSHLSSCEKCQTRYQNATCIQSTLKSLPIIPASEGFARRALRHAEKQNINHHKRGFMLGFGSAVAAMLIMAVVLGQFLFEPKIGKDGIQDFAIRLHETKDIKLVFSAPRKLLNAKVTITLPAHVNIVGFPGQQELTWFTDLAQGENLLRLPVIAQNMNHGQIVARIEHSRKVKTFRLALKIDSDGLSQKFQYLDLKTNKSV